MHAATHEDVYRLFPGIQDHAVVDLLETQPTVGELEAASQLLEGNDERLIVVKQQSGDRLNHLVAILVDAQVEPVSGRE